MMNSGTTEADLQELREMGQDLASAISSSFEPTAIAQAFATPGRGHVPFTMQMWIDLAAIKSPILQEESPETVDEFAAAAQIFGLEIEELSTEEMADVLARMKDAVRRGFSMNLQMEPEDGQPGEGGFGTWLLIWAALITECGVAPAAACALEVGQAFGLLAAKRRAQGWRVKGVAYALRGISTSNDADQQPTEGES